MARLDLAVFDRSLHKLGLTAVSVRRDHQAARNLIRNLCAEVSAHQVQTQIESAALFDQGHVPGATNLPHGKIIGSRMSAYPPPTLFIAYCAGPHCNGAARAAAKLARLGYAVKIMAGGMTGWMDEGFELEQS